MSRAIGVGIAWALFVAFLVWVSAHTFAQRAWLALVALPAGYLIADLSSGVLHWFCDTFFGERTPLIGSRLIRPFREHHRCPEHILLYRAREQHAGGLLVLVPLVVVGWAQAWPGPKEVHVLAGCWGLLGLTFGAAGATVFHKWAHMPRPPRCARWLQGARLILRPAHHAEHHRDPRRRYCVTSGWCNHLLDGAQLFERIGRVMGASSPQQRRD